MGMLRGMHYIWLEIPLDYSVPWESHWDTPLTKTIMIVLVRLSSASLEIYQLIAFLCAPAELINSSGEESDLLNRD